MKQNLKCPVISTERLETLLLNMVTFMNTEYLQYTMELEQKLNFFKREIGFTDEEIEKLDLIEKCLKGDNYD